MTPLLTDDWQDRFDIPVTLAGAALYRAGAVHLHPSHGRGRTAQVRDRRTYDVHFDGDRAGCTCMVRQETGPCAHLWAMFLAVDALPPVPVEAPPAEAAAPEVEPEPVAAALVSED